MKMSFYSNVDDARICETSRTTNAQNAFVFTNSMMH